MSSGCNSKSSPASDNTMCEVFTEGQSFTLPDGKYAESLTGVVTRIPRKRDYFIIFPSNLAADAFCPCH